MPPGPEVRPTTTLTKGVNAVGVKTMVPALVITGVNAAAEVGPVIVIVLPDAVAL